MEVLENNLNDILTEYEKRKLFYKNSIDTSNKYELIMAEPEMITIKENLECLEKKGYNFKCELLLNGLYNNQKKQIYKTSINGPFKINIIDEHLNFMKDKVYNDFYEIEREIAKERINILSNNDIENNCVYNKKSKQFIFKCSYCGCFGNSNVNNKNKQYFEDAETNLINSSANSYYIVYPCGQIPQCKKCQKDWIDKSKLNFLYFLNDCTLYKESLEIGRNDGGSISYYHACAKIEKI